MATITKTFTENIGNTPYSTWTLTASGINAVASEPTFEFTAPVVTAKFVNSQRKFALVRINDLLTLADGTIIIGFTHDRGGGVEDPVATNSGTQYTLSPDPDKRTAITSRIFNTNNPRERVVNVHFKQRTVTLETRTTETTGVSRYYSSEQIDWGVVATITLDAPPTYTLSALSKDTSDYYANLTTVSVTISSATAQYGGDISISSLTIGSQTVTGSGNGTLSMRLNNAGTFTPTVIVTDSRGQSTTKTLETITVQPYLVPSVTFDVYRTNDTGIKNDEGHYALIQSTISYTDAIATLIEPSIQIDGVDLSSLTDASVTWYTTWSNTSGVSNVISDWTTLVPQNHMVTIYGLIDWDYDTTGNFAEDTSYQITLVANDSVNGHSTPITQTMSTAFYTIDFQAGGKEIAFGAPANDDITNYEEGLFKCAMSFRLKDHLIWIGTRSEYDEAVDGGKMPEHSIVIITDEDADYIVEQGTDGIWTYRKWASGIAEAWRRTGSYSYVMTNTVGGNGYTSDYWTLPSGLFTSVTEAHVNRINGGNGLVSCSIYSMTTSRIDHYIWVTGATATITMELSIEVKGTWK